MSTAAPPPPTQPAGRPPSSPPGSLPGSLPGSPPESPRAPRPGSRAPTAEEEAGLRRVVGVLAGSSRPPPTVCRVGRPGGTSHDFVVVPVTGADLALRTDVVAALLARARRLRAAPACWLSRPGPLSVEDADLAWYAAARAAYGEAGVPLLMVVATRHGWYAPGTGHHRAWRRLRLDR